MFRFVNPYTYCLRIFNIYEKAMTAFSALSWLLFLSSVDEYRFFAFIVLFVLFVFVLDRLDHVFINYRIAAIRAYKINKRDREYEHDKCACHREQQRQIYAYEYGKCYEYECAYIAFESEHRKDHCVFVKFLQFEIEVYHHKIEINPCNKIEESEEDRKVEADAHYIRRTVVIIENYRIVKQIYDDNVSYSDDKSLFPVAFNGVPEIMPYGNVVASYYSARNVRHADIRKSESDYERKRRIVKDLSPCGPNGKRCRNTENAQKRYRFEPLRIVFQSTVELLIQA